MSRLRPLLAIMLFVGATTVHAQDGAPVETSLGTPQNGRIAGGGRELAPRGPGYHWATNRANRDARYGTPALVDALVRAAAEVLSRHPGSDLAIHDLSFERGGRIHGHGSHTSGRDVDVAYYARDASGAPIDPSNGHWFLPDGRARGLGGADAPRFDAARTWLFLAALLRDRSIDVQYVFMHPALQRLLLTHARDADRGGQLVARLETVLRRPRGRLVDPHADHFHVRIRCARADLQHGCANGR